MESPEINNFIEKNRPEGAQEESTIFLAIYCDKNFGKLECDGNEGDESVHCRRKKKLNEPDETSLTLLYSHSFGSSAIHC